MRPRSAQVRAAETPKTNLRFWLRLGPTVCLAMALTGCESVREYSLTCRLWDNGDLRKWSEPAPFSNIALYAVTNEADVLVQYDAFSEKHSVVARRSYFLQPNRERLAQAKKPVFVTPPATGLCPIPLLPPEAEATNPPPELHAMVGREGRGFILCRPGQPREDHELPVYRETTGTTTRIALTPFAVVGDTAGVAAGAAVIGFLVWVQAGAPTN